MTRSLYLTVAGRSPQRHATLPVHQIIHFNTHYYSVLYSSSVPYYSVLQRATPVHCVQQSSSGYLPKFHHMLRLPRKVTLQHHQMLRLPPKVRFQRHQITAPGTSNDSHG